MCRLCPLFGQLRLIAHDPRFKIRDSRSKDEDPSGALLTNFPTSARVIVFDPKATVACIVCARILVFIFWEICQHRFYRSIDPHIDRSREVARLRSKSISAYPQIFAGKTIAASCGEKSNEGVLHWYLIYVLFESSGCIDDTNYILTRWWFFNMHTRVRHLVWSHLSPFGLKQWNKFEIH